jgi:pimeloyl-ACP methyl ester carboxylesterase
MTDVVLVHGAWHGAWCWARVVDDLDALGVSAVAVELPLRGFAGDAATARAAIEAAGPGVVVVGHSYGGMVVSEAAADVPGIGRVVYLTAFMLEQGETEGPIMARYESPILTNLVAVDGGIVVDPAKVHEIFYGDSDAATVAEIIPRLRPMDGDDGSRPTKVPAWKSVPSTYVVCTEDRALPPAAQREMATRAEVVVEWATDHSPFLTRPGDLAALLASSVPA